MTTLDDQALRVQIMVAKFDRDFSTHERYRDSYATALENFRADVAAWSDQRGVQAEVVPATQFNESLGCPINVVYVEMDHSDLTILRLLEDPVLHRQSRGISADLTFSEWKQVSEPEIHPLKKLQQKQ